MGKRTNNMRYSNGNGYTTLPERGPGTFIHLS